MPVLSKVIKTKQLTLPISRATVQIVTMLTLADEEYINSTLNDQEQSVRYVTRAIKSWDFTEEGGAALPVTEENVRLMPNVDGQFILSQFIEEAKAAREKAEAKAMPVETAKPEDVPETPAEEPAK